MFTNKDLKKLIIPLMIERLLAVSVGMADIIMVSVVGEAAVSGVSLVDMINVLLIDIFSAMATGGAVITSQFIGQGSRERANKSAEQLFFITAVISISIMMIVLLTKKTMLRIVFGQIDENVMKNAVLYFTISSVSYPFIALYNAGAAVFRSMGNSKVSMISSAIMNLLNICGNAVFVFVFHAGVAGIAFSSLASRAFAAVLIMILLKSKKEYIHIGAYSKIRPDKVFIKKILSIGIPNGLENSIFQLGRIIVVSIITMFGTVQIAANAIANNIDAFGILPGQAVSLAMITVVGQCVGAGDFEGVKKYTKKLLKITYIVMLSLNFLLLLFLPLILKIYHLSAATTDLAYILIFIHNGFAILLWPLSFVLPNALRAANDVKFTMFVSIFSMFTFRIVFSYIIAVNFGYGAIGVWAAMIIDWIFRIILFVTRFLRGKWKTMALRANG